MAGAAMPATYSCRDIGMPCQWAVREKSEAEILEKIRAHLAEAHHTPELSPEALTEIKRAIRAK